MFLLWPPELLDNLAVQTLMAESPEFLGLYMRVLQVAAQSELDGLAQGHGGRPLTPKRLSLAHFRTPEKEALCAQFLETAIAEGLLYQEGPEIGVAWWADFSKVPSETHTAWKERKAKERRLKRERPTPEQPSAPLQEPVGECVTPPVVTCPEPSVTCHDPTNQPTNQPTNHLHHPATSRDAHAKPEPRNPHTTPRSLPPQRQAANGRSAPGSDLKPAGASMRSALQFGAENQPRPP